MTQDELSDLKALIRHAEESAVALRDAQLVKLGADGRLEDWLSRHTDGRLKDWLSQHTDGRLEDWLSRHTHTLKEK